MFYELYCSSKNIQVWSYENLEEYLHNEGKEGIFLDNHDNDFIPKEIFTSSKYIKNIQDSQFYILFGSAENLLDYFLKNITKLRKKIDKEILDFFIFELENFQIVHNKKKELVYDL